MLYNQTGCVQNSAGLDTNLVPNRRIQNCSPVPVGEMNPQTLQFLKQSYHEKISLLHDNLSRLETRLQTIRIVGPDCVRDDARKDPTTGSELFNEFRSFLNGINSANERICKLINEIDL